jgi:hypothetical protein
VRPVQASAIGKHVLGPAVLPTESTHFRPDLLLDGLHQQQCGASLVLTILVITSENGVSR